MTNAATPSDANLDSTLSSQHGKCNGSRENTNAEDGKINKDASEIDNNVVGASHDKDNIPKTFNNTGLPQGEDTNAKNEKQAKENCLIQFVILCTLLQDISKEDLTNTCFSSGFQQAFFKMDSIEKVIVQRGFYKRAHNRRENERVMQTQEKMINMVKDNYDVGLVVNERSEIQSKKQNKSSRSRNDTRAEGAYTNLSNETEQMHEVQSTAAYNVFANDKQHAEQPKFINEGGVDQDAEQRLDKRPLLAFAIENKTIDSLNQTLESEMIVSKRPL
nr:hypothetical protein [Tanacetum cinerariifolium]